MYLYIILKFSELHILVKKYQKLDTLPLAEEQCANEIILNLSTYIYNFKFCTFKN